MVTTGMIWETMLFFTFSKVEVCSLKTFLNVRLKKHKRRNCESIGCNNFDTRKSAIIKKVTLLKGIIAYFY
jgi:hypothetical protein